MHPAMADSTLHLSLVPSSKNGPLQPLDIKIPVSLGALTVPGRRNGLLRAAWAAAGSDPVPGAASVTGDMTLSAATHTTGAASFGLQFARLISKAVSAGKRGHRSWDFAASQVVKTEEHSLATIACQL